MINDKITEELLSKMQEEEVKYKIVNKKNGTLLEPSVTEQKVLQAMAKYQDARALYLENKHEAGELIPPTGLSEDMQLSLILQSERLRKLDMNMEREDEWQVTTNGVKKISNAPDFFYDGQGMIGHLRKHMKSTVSYHKKPHRQWGPGTSFWDFLEKDYYFTEGEDGSFLLTAEEVLLPKEEYNRSCDYWDDKRWKLEKMRVGAWLACTIFFWILHLGSLAVFVLTIFTSSRMDDIGALAFCYWIVSIVAAAPLGFDLKRTLPSYKNRKASYRILQKIRLNIPNFCINDFVSMAQNRIMSIFYAERMEQIASFVNLDVSPFLLRHTYVVNCEALNFWFEDFGQDGENRYIDVKQKLRLTIKEQGNKVKRSTVYVKARFTSPINGIMTQDWYIDNVEVLKKNGR